MVRSSASKPFDLTGSEDDDDEIQVLQVISPIEKSTCQGSDDRKRKTALLSNDASSFGYLPAYAKKQKSQAFNDLKRNAAAAGPRKKLDCLLSDDDSIQSTTLENLSQGSVARQSNMPTKKGIACNHATKHGFDDVKVICVVRPHANEGKAFNHANKHGSNDVEVIGVSCDASPAKRGNSCNHHYATKHGVHGVQAIGVSKASPKSAGQKSPARTKTGKTTSAKAGGKRFAPKKDDTGEKKRKTYNDSEKISIQQYLGQSPPYSSATVRSKINYHDLDKRDQKYYEVMLQAIWWDLQPEHRDQSSLFYHVRKKLGKKEYYIPRYSGYPAENTEKK